MRKGKIDWTSVPDSQPKSSKEAREKLLSYVASTTQTLGNGYLEDSFVKNFQPEKQREHNPVINFQIFFHFEESLKYILLIWGIFQLLVAVITNIIITPLV